MKEIIRMNLRRNKEVTTEDLNLAKKTFRSDIGTLNGKMVRTKPHSFLDNTINMLKDLLRVNCDEKLL